MTRKPKRTPCDLQDKYAAQLRAALILMIDLSVHMDAQLRKSVAAFHALEARARPDAKLFQRPPRPTRGNLEIGLGWWAGLTNLERSYVLNQAEEVMGGPASAFDAWWLWEKGHVRTQPAPDAAK